MSHTTYTYSKTTNFANGIVAGELQSIIERNVGIATILIRVTELDPPSTDVEIEFEDALSVPEKTVLDAIVLAYKPIPQEVQEVVVQEESTKTGGHFQSFTVPLLSDSLAVTVHDEVMFVDTSALAIHYVTLREHTGDMFSVHVAPDTPVGAIVADVSIGDTVIYVSPDVFTYAYKGPCLASLSDGVNSEPLGRIKSLNPEASTVTVETPSTQAFTAAPIPNTYFRITAALLHNSQIGPPWEYIVGESKIGGSYVKEGVTVRTIYTNRSPPLNLGKITTNVSIGDTVINVEAVAFDILCWGDKVDLYNGTNTEPLGTVSLIDPSNGQVTVTTPSAQTFLAVVPTYLRKTAKQLVAQIEILQ